MRKTKTERDALKLARAESNARIAAAKAEMREHVARGTCPVCGERIRRNLSLTGWYQCDQFGAEGFRKNAAKPSCNFQGFTE